MNTYFCYKTIIRRIIKEIIIIIKSIIILKSTTHDTVNSVMAVSCYIREIPGSTQWIRWWFSNLLFWWLSSREWPRSILDQGLGVDIISCVDVSTCVIYAFIPGIPCQINRVVTLVFLNFSLHYVLAGIKTIYTYLQIFLLNIMFTITKNPKMRIIKKVRQRLFRNWYSKFYFENQRINKTDFPIKTNCSLSLSLSLSLSFSLSLFHIFVYVILFICIIFIHIVFYM